MLPSVLRNCNIYTYDWAAASVGEVSDDALFGHAGQLLNRLRIKRKVAGTTNAPLIFIASCFSGLLLAKALVRAADPYDEHQSILKHTVGVLFLATPFNGSDERHINATSIRKAAAIKQNIKTSDNLTKLLGGAGARDELYELVQRFTNMNTHEDFKFPIRCFYETLPTDFSQVVKELEEDFRNQLGSDNKGVLVDKHSASLHGVKCNPLERRHSMMNKFNKPDDESYLQVVEVLQGFWNNARQVLGSRITLQKTASEMYRQFMCERRDLYPDVLDWLWKGDYSERHRTFDDLWHPGTVKWIFEDSRFLSWKPKASSGQDQGKNGEASLGSDHRILWCHGGPGVGKSVLMSQVVRFLEEAYPKDAVVYLFCSHMDHMPRDLRKLLSCLIKQVARKSIDQAKLLPPEIMTAFQGKTELSLEKLQEVLKDLLEGFEHPFILVDGLDEIIQSDSRGEQIAPNIEILDCLLKVITACKTPCKLFLASRDNSLALYPGIDAIKIPIQARDEDMRLCFTARLKDKDFPHRDAVRDNKELEMQILDTLLDKAQGQFLLPTLHFTTLKEQQSVRQMKLELGRLPLDLFEKYAAVLERILAMATSGKSTGLDLLGVTLHLCDSVTTLAFQQILATWPDDEVFDKCGIPSGALESYTFGLLIVENDKVCFPHSTIREFLLQKPIYEKHFSGYEDYLASRCLTYLSLSDFSTAVDDQEKRYRDFPFLPYAAKFLGHHAEKALECQSPGPQSPILLDKLNCFIDGQVPLGTLQVWASTVLQNPIRARIPIWRDNLAKLHLAIVAGLNLIVAHLVKKVDIEEIAWKEETALHIAARAANEVAVDILLQNNADINKTNYSGKNALDMIMAKPFLRVWTKTFQPDGVDFLNMLVIKVLMSVLVPSTKAEKIIVQKLRDEGSQNFVRAFISKPKPEKQKSLTELMLASDMRMELSDKQKIIAIKLINKGIELNSRGSAMHTPLQLAAMYGHMEIVKLLLEKGANPWVDYTFGYNALELAKNRHESKADTKEELVCLIKDTMDKITKQEEAVENELQKIEIPGPRQAEYIVKKSEENGLQRFVRLEGYTPKGSEDQRLLLECAMLKALFSTTEQKDAQTSQETQ
ncbi:hypothetical protein F5Y16DRAFT_362489 [Xylariaceae sp. FL0255]|nr:hypothetical protein F5Y16DRAFT_362489 [Xylariaceae sp. FL0255]